eukprot:scaffold1525_cov142-Cylindrotheca_fusiformis.AAC.86
MSAGYGIGTNFLFVPYLTFEGCLGSRAICGQRTAHVVKRFLFIGSTQEKDCCRAFIHST